MKEKLIEIKTELCNIITKDISNLEKQKLGELYTLLDLIILDKLNNISSKDYNYLYKELINKLVKNPGNMDAKTLLERIKNYNVSTEGYIILKLLQVKIILQGSNNPVTEKIIKLISEFNIN